MTNIISIDDYDLAGALQVVAGFGTQRYGYLVTPNVDHIIRQHDDHGFRELYAQAAFVLLDSRFLAHTVAVIKRQYFKVCQGSDLTTNVLSDIVNPFDAVVLVGGTAQQAQALRERFGLKALEHINPPMNFIRDVAAVENCLQAIEAASPFRFCFLAIGSPQQEIIAQKLKERGRARGLALCVGAAVNFLTGIEKRAPRWMQHLGFEWLFRLMQDPRRMAKRYLVRGPRIFLLLWRMEFRLRRAAVAVEVKDISDTPATTTIIGSTGQIV